MLLQTPHHVLELRVTVLEQEFILRNSSSLLRSLFQVTRHLTKGHSKQLHRIVLLHCKDIYKVASVCETSKSNKCNDAKNNDDRPAE